MVVLNITNVNFTTIYDNGCKGGKIYKKKFVGERTKIAEKVCRVPVKFFLVTNRTVPREDFIIIPNFFNAVF